MFKLKTHFLLLICFITLNANAQTVDIIKKSAFKSVDPSKTFAFVEPALDASSLQSVATIRARINNKKSVIESLFSSIRNQADSLGANCFIVQSFNRSDSAGDAVLIIDCYYADQATLDKNNGLREKNTVYIFGKEKEDGGRSVYVNINDKTTEVEPGAYVKYPLKEDEQLEINKGGSAGETLSVEWKKNKPAVFYTLTGFGLNDKDQQVAKGVLNAGKINQINDLDLGWLLVHLLKRCN